MRFFRGQNISARPAVRARATGNRAARNGPRLLTSNLYLLPAGFTIFGLKIAHTYSLTRTHLLHTYVLQAYTHTHKDIYLYTYIHISAGCCRGAAGEKWKSVRGQGMNDAKMVCGMNDDEPGLNNVEI